MKNYAIACYKDQLVLVGGAHHSRLTKKVYVWRKGENKWDGDVIPEMEDEREDAVALGHQRYLVVLGGSRGVFWLAGMVATGRKSVEIFDGNSWKQAAPLVQSSLLLQSVSNGVLLFILQPEKGIVHYCSIETLISSSLGSFPDLEKKLTWKVLEPAAPHSRCCIAALTNSLLAVAGVGSRGAIFMYDPARQEWGKVTCTGSLPSLRNASCVEITPRQLLVCGGDMDLVTDVEETQLTYSLRVTESQPQ